MAQNCGGWCWSLRLVSSLAIGGAYAFSWDSTFAQITPDNTLPNTSSVKLEGNTRIIIEGGTQAGSNLFHSFGEFSVPTGSTAFFNNAFDIQNIISRVTGGSVSHINGVINANDTANLFLINPNGIIFGPHAQLKIGGSFLASTASSLKFADGTEFSAKAPQNTPLLTVSVPIGLQFGQTPGEIRNESRVPLIDRSTGNPVLDEKGVPLLAGLQVAPGRTLALVGDSVNLPGGVMTAPGGRIELGSVAGVGEVSLNQRDHSWVLGYDQVNTFGEIRLKDMAFINASGERGGDIQIRGHQLDMIQRARIYADTQGTSAGGEVLIQTDEAITLSGISQITADVTKTGTGAGGNVTLTTQRLSLQQGAQVSTSTEGSGRGGNLSIIATDSVEMRGIGILNRTPESFSGLVTQTYNIGDAGNITIATRRLSVYSGAQVSASSRSTSTGKAGNLTVKASNVELIGTTADDASYVELFGTTADLQYPSGLFTQTQSGQGGDINLQVQDLLLLRRRSTISTTAKGSGDGGNIKIDTKFLVSVPVENSAIFANAFEGKGGFINITAQGVFGIARREQLTQLSDITAFSQQNPQLNGTVQINTLDVDPNRGLVELPTNLVDASNQIDTSCTPGGRQRASSFTITGRGGLPLNPREAFNSDTVRVGWVTLKQSSDNRFTSPVTSKQTTDTLERIVEATGWVINEKKEVVLTANAPTRPHNPWSNPTECSSS